MTARAKKYRLLTPQLYEDDPKFFVQAIAYRLIHMFTPKPLTKRLPKGLQRPLLGTGSIVPVGLPTFPGLIVPPGIEIPSSWGVWFLFMVDKAYDLDTLFPPGWTPGDPMPEGVSINTAIIFPPGWTPGDQLPDNVTVDPGASFPPGWTPGDLLPAGVHYDWGAVIPPGWTPDNPPPGSWIPGYDPSAKPTPDGPAPPDPFGPFPPGPPRPPSPSPPGYPKTKSFIANHSSWIWKVADTWDGAHDATEGDDIVNDLTERHDAVATKRSDPEFNINRTFFSFDLSSIPADCTITAATLTISCYDPTAEMRNITLRLGTQSVPGDVIDFDAFGTTMCAYKWATAGTIEYTIYSTRYYLIEAAFGGIMKFCIREQNRDDADSLPPDGTDSHAGIRLSGHANPALRPTLTLTYTK